VAIPSFIKDADMKYFKLLEPIEKEVTRLFQQSTTGSLLYHNLTHTKSVVASASEMARYYELSDHDFFIVIAAAWFHDTGYLTGSYEDHEIRSAAMAEAFLEKNELDEATIYQVKNCILATHIPQQPANLLEEIVSDADLFHLGSKEFSELSKKMKKEQELLSDTKINKTAWRMATLQLLESHHYRTGYAKKKLEHIKQENILKLKDKIKIDEAEKIGTSENAVIADNNVAPIFYPQGKEYIKKPERGIETMFRISSNNHQRLSDMADNKANIMITTTSIILSILLSVLLRKLEDNPHLIIPSFLLLTVCLLTMIFAIKATRPVLPDGRFTKEEMDEKKTNLLFFGNFYNMSYQEYHQGMEAMMNDRSFLYGSLTMDVYSQGIVLGKKYRLLRRAYNLFMYGISGSVIAFFLAVMLAMY
jgi:predicted metal-dependent HD superfamily phosphohydrolase